MEDAQRIISNWVEVAKIRWAVSDNLYDEIIFEILVLSRARLWTSFYGFYLTNEDVPDHHRWAFDNITMHATIALGGCVFTNPIGESDTSKCDKLAINIIGNRMKYG